MGEAAADEDAVNAVVFGEEEGERDGKRGKTCAAAACSATHTDNTRGDQSAATWNHNSCCAWPTACVPASAALI